MADEYYPIPDKPQYRAEIRKLQNSDPAGAEQTFNPLIATLIENTAAVKKQAEEAQAAANMVTTIDANSTDTQYPSAKSVYDFVMGAVYPVGDTLNDTDWETISKVSQAGLGEQFWEVGDTKKIHLEGTVGTLELNTDLYVYILGFDHNAEIEGRGITFGTFKTADGKDVCLVDSKYNTNAGNTGGMYFQMNHWGTTSGNYNTNFGGWKGCDARYDILGSTNVKPDGYGATPTTSRSGYDPSSYDIVGNPVSNTLMAALPTDLRAAMKPITKYTDNYGNNSDVANHVTTSLDYLPLLSEFEIFGGNRTYANQYEKDYQQQYAYYAASNSKVKNCHDQTGTAASWWERSPYYSNARAFCFVNTSGSASDYGSRYSSGLAPAFMV